MTKINLSELSIKKAHELMHSGDISARQLLEFYLDNIKKHDKDIHAYLELFGDAFENAEEVDKAIKSGKEVPLLAGIPMAIKDNLLIKGKKCSSGSKILENHIATYDATVIDKLKKEGVVFVGRTNMDEFAMGSSTENSAYGPTRNPHDHERVPGGSSGGSAAAVAQQECLAAIGSDTGGSVRQPAAFCGVVGFKPTYGAVSRHGLMAMSSSLDQIGPFTKTVEDAEIIFNVIKGEDPMDSTTANIRPSSDSKIKTIGVPKEFFNLEGETEGVDKEVAKAVLNSIEIFKNLGFKIKPISIPSLKYAIETYYIIMPAEVSSNLARYDGIRYGLSEDGENLLDVYMKSKGEGFGPETKRRLMLGAYVLSSGFYDAYYIMAKRAVGLMKKSLKETFKDVDVLLSPTTPTPAFRFGEKTANPVEMYLADIFTSAANLTGIPGISIPCLPHRQAGLPAAEARLDEASARREGKKLPIGLQLMAPWFEENKLFELGKLFENNL